MTWNFYKILNLFDSDNKVNLLLDGMWGLERETHRITNTGDIALTNHPKELGDKLENPNITTDFGESQLEFITFPYNSLEKVYEELKSLHIKTEEILKDEILWSMSMPPRLPKEEDIPIAKFNNTEEGKIKEIYRRGLAIRYGKKMQMISGIHYNFSLGNKIIDYLFEHFGQGKNKRQFIDEIYFCMARNFLKYRWLLIYLFGASPNFDNSFGSFNNQDLSFATSIRVSPLGYGNISRDKYYISYNSLSEHIKDVKKLLNTKNPQFTKLGIYKNGEQIQLNDNILQTEGELYSCIRFKQATNKGETPLQALQKRGIKYIEVRVLDINPFEKTGISIDQLYFMHVFMLFCLFETSEKISKEIMKKINRNHDLVSLYGRKDNLILENYDGSKINLKNWSKDIFRKIRDIAIFMDKCQKYKKYEYIINKEYEKVLNTSGILSSKIINEMHKCNETFLEFGLRRAILNKQIK
ncbi:glutamate--cysteine ligase [Defluviitalea phaphyphila]|uniref:glutamate--cysteine ligase n=1 Tax=Defluviitalea phaphyphila TaxID=1473580 RepID=UPI000730BD55|nr:glutamate--cysteine ligase [Defluviitalea phaphyphila]